MLNISKIKAITLDLDDTLWPIWPTIERAEEALATWLRRHAPATAQVFANAPQRLRLREHVVSTRPDIGHDMSALRLEVIRQALLNCGEDTTLAPAAFEVFFDARMKVELFEDAVPALEFLAGRFPVVALSNGNADVHRVGIGRYFRGSLSAHLFGVGKPDPRIFHAAAACGNCAAHEVLHIGDDVELDVLGAHAVGMQTVWVNRGNLAWPHADRPHLTVSSLAQVVQAVQGAHNSDSAAHGAF
jgi:FMN hydrolase / 5-amino-6-(5-phospho-D-ribitylamino)uracil phosphatase